MDWSGLEPETSAFSDICEGSDFGYREQVFTLVIYH